MLIECSTCSQLGAERSNPQGEARGGESVSRNASELASASLNYLGAGQPVRMGEACYNWRSNIHRTQLTPRGDWRQRAETDWLRNLGYPRGTAEWESEGSIVVKKQGNFCGAKGSYCE